MNKIKHAPNLNFVILASSRLTPFRATTSRHLPRGRSPQYFFKNFIIVHRETKHIWWILTIGRYRLFVRNRWK